MKSLRDPKVPRVSHPNDEITNYNSDPRMVPNYSRKRMSRAELDKDLKTKSYGRYQHARAGNKVPAYQGEKRRYGHKTGTIPTPTPTANSESEGLKSAARIRLKGIR